MHSEYNGPHACDPPLSKGVPTPIGWDLCLQLDRNWGETKRTCGKQVISALCFRGSLCQSDLSLSNGQMVLAIASFQGNWRTVLSSSFHLEYDTIFCNVYGRLNPANGPFLTSS